jgi:hypothetical protein
MMNQVDESDFVLVVCTEKYNLRYRNREAQGQGRGVTWEGGLIIAELYEGQGINKKFIPVLLSPEGEKHIPRSLQPYTIYRLFNSEDYDVEKPGDYQSLYRHLTKQPAYSLPQLGKPQRLPSLNTSSSGEEKNGQQKQVEQPLPVAESSNKLEPLYSQSESSTAPPSQDTCTLTSSVLEMDSRALQQNLTNIQGQGTLEQCREVITQTSQWLLQHPNESFVRNQLLKLVQTKAERDQQLQIIDQTTCWLLENLEASNSFTLTEYLKLVTSQGTLEQGQSAVSLTLRWFAQQNDPFVRSHCLKLAKDKATSETAQELLNQTYSWLSENLEGCDSYVMTEYLRLVIERGNAEQRQQAKEQAAISLEKEDNPYVRTQYLKLLKITG